MRYCRCQLRHSLLQPLMPPAPTDPALPHCSSNSAHGRLTMRRVDIALCCQCDPYLEAAQELHSHPLCHAITSSSSSMLLVASHHQGRPSRGPLLTDHLATQQVHQGKAVLGCSCNQLCGTSR
jgi:hypothetical protein